MKFPATVSKSLLAGAFAIAMLSLPATASAGRLIVTGHDADSHCIRDAVNTPNPGACSYVDKSVAWIRAGSPSPSRPVLVLDRGALDLQKSLAALGVPTVVLDPRSPEFASAPVNTTLYSAVAIASSKDDPADPTPQDLNEQGSTPDTDAINARSSVFSSFFASGGGMVVFSGGRAARANSAKYYGFLKITRGGNPVAPPFTLLPLGASLGFTDERQPPAANMINCCETHVAFDVPAPESPLKVAELDRAQKAVTLIANTASLDALEEPLTTAKFIFGTMPKKKGAVCVARKGLKVTLRRPKGIRYAKISVYVNGKRKKTVKSNKLGVKSKTKAFRVKLSTKKRSKVRIVATTASGRTYTYKHTFKPC